jgi:hypothetical protein
MVPSKKTQHIIAAMSDPLSVAAVVVGISAFGLQACRNLNQGSPLEHCIGITFTGGKET